MAGYDEKSTLRNVNYALMNGRLGYTDRQDPLSKPLVPEERIDPNDDCTDTIDPSIIGLSHQRIRLTQHGGLAQQERMIYDKRRSLESALLYSYQGANISKIGEEQKLIRALINPNKTKQDYDDKIVSVGYEYGFKPGDVFQWVGTNSYWLIYLQDLTELAYFRGDIRRCSYEVNWVDEDGEHSSWIALRGPVETKIDYIQKHQISIDKPNYTLNVLMPKTDAALKYFKRYAKFYLQDSDICWKVTAVDSLSTPGIIEFTALEDYSNITEDDVEKGIVGALKPIQENPNTAGVEVIIDGPTFIKPQFEYEYQFKGIGGNHWQIDTKKYPVKYIEDPLDARHMKLIWTAAYSGQFDITYGPLTKTIIVESLF